MPSQTNTSDFASLRQKLAADFNAAKINYERTSMNLKKFDTFLVESGIASSPKVSTNGTGPAASNTNGKTSARRGRPPGSGKGVKTAGKTTAAPAAAKTKGRRGRKPGSTNKASAKTSGKGGKADKTAAPNTKANGPREITLKEAMCKVIGKKSMKADEVYAGLKAMGHVLHSNNPAKHVAYTLSSESEIFPKAERGVYRADPSKLPQGRGRRPSSPEVTTAASTEKTDAKTADPAVTDALDALGYNPNNPPIFATETAATA